VRGPRVSSRKRSATRAAICSSESIRKRAAASSIASGNPSSSEQMLATNPTSAAVVSKPGRASRARSTNNDTASDPAMSPSEAAASCPGSDSEGTRHSRSPSTPNGARLVASTTSSGAAMSSDSTAPAHAPSRCSQLSSTSNARREAR
jgi:hypothetical protein